MAALSSLLVDIRALRPSEVLPIHFERSKCVSPSPAKAAGERGKATRALLLDERDDERASLRELIEVRDVLECRHVLLEENAVRVECLRLAVIDARSVEADRVRRARASSSQRSQQSCWPAPARSTAPVGMPPPGAHVPGTAVTSIRPDGQPLPPQEMFVHDPPLTVFTRFVQVASENRESTPLHDAPVAGPQVQSLQLR